MIIQTLREKGWRMLFKHDKRYFGWCDYEKREINVDVFSSIATVIIHEAIHAQNPEMEEYEVLIRERTKMRTLSRHEVMMVIREYSEQLYQALLPFGR